MDYSDTESELASLLSQFAISRDQRKPEQIEKRTEIRLHRSSMEDIRVLSATMTQRFLSHEFQVRGSTGKIYTVKIGPKLDCTCRDQKTRGTHCKHILYILSQELNFTDLSSKIYITLFPSDQLLNDIFKNYH